MNRQENFAEKTASTDEIRFVPGSFCTPNWHVDRLGGLLSPAESAVLQVIVRLTLGWRRRRASISQRTLRNLTGLGRDAARAAVEALARYGVIRRHELLGTAPKIEIVLEPEAVDWVAVEAAANARRGGNHARTHRARQCAGAVSPQPESPAPHTSPPADQGGPSACPPHSITTKKNNTQGEPRPVEVGLVETFDAARREALATHARETTPVPIAAADARAIADGFAREGILRTELVGLVEWMATHPWPRRRDLLRHPGPLASAKVMGPMVADWRAEQLAKSDAGADEKRAAAADQARQKTYLAGLRRGMIAERAIVEAKIYSADVLRWRRSPAFRTAEAAAWAEGEAARVALNSRRDRVSFSLE